MNGLIELPPKPVCCGLRADIDGVLVAVELPVGWEEKAENGVAEDEVDVVWADNVPKGEEVELPERFVDA